MGGQELPHTLFPRSCCSQTCQMDRHELVDELWTGAGIVPSSYSAEHPNTPPEAHAFGKAGKGGRKGHPAA